MAPVPTVQLGVVADLEDDVVWGLPIRSQFGYCSPANAALEASIDEAFTTPIAIVVGTDGSFISNAPFIRAHNDTASIIVKAQ